MWSPFVASPPGNLQADLGGQDFRKALRRAKWLSVSREQASHQPAAYLDTSPAYGDFTRGVQFTDEPAHPVAGHAYPFRQLGSADLDRFASAGQRKAKPNRVGAESKASFVQA